MGNERKLFSDIYYHIYNRGFNKQTLFFEERDFNRLGCIIDRYRNDEKYQTIKILAYCLLPNHFHFLIIDDDANETGLETKKISELFHRIQLSYAMYFNLKYGDKVKQGLKMPVFEGRFKAKEIIDDNYLNHLKNYIEFNAVKHGMVDEPSEWQYSSYDSSTPINKQFLILDDFNSYFE